MWHSKMHETAVLLNFLLKPLICNSFPTSVPCPHPVQVENHKEYEIQSIIDSRRYHGSTWFIGKCTVRRNTLGFHPLTYILLSSSVHSIDVFPSNLVVPWGGGIVEEGVLSGLSSALPSQSSVLSCRLIASTLHSTVTHLVFIFCSSASPAGYLNCLDQISCAFAYPDTLRCVFLLKTFAWLTSLLVPDPVYCLYYADLCIPVLLAHSNFLLWLPNPGYVLTSFVLFVPLYD